MDIRGPTLWSGYLRCSLAKSESEKGSENVAVLDQ